MDETLTVTRTLKIGLNTPDFRKWERMRLGGSKQESMVIRIRDVGTHMNHSVQYTLHPIPIFKKKWRFKLWFKWLKFKVWIGDFYKK